jgi:multidrug transporter EmrE-like cation transporter
MNLDESNRVFPWLMVGATILLTAYGQVMLKWEVDRHAQPVFAWASSWPSVLQLLLRPGVISAFAAAFGASLCWMIALRHLPLSHAYPFTALNFVLISLLAVSIFGESMPPMKMAGLGLIVVGILLVGRS